MAIVVFEGVEPVDASGPASVFSRAARLVPGSYEIVFASPKGGEVTTEAGLRLSGLAPISRLRDIDTLIVTGGDEPALRRAIFQDGLADWIGARAPRIRRIASVCTGAFILAAAGLLHDRRAATHWGSCDLLTRLSPATRVDSDAIYVIDGKICSSAGVSAGIDLSLALVEQDLGAPVAARIAREMVLFLRRPGGQSQYSASLAAQATADADIATLIAWAVDHPAADLSVAALAARTGMSERTFARAFRRETGVTPAQFVTRLRLDAARRWLETTRWPLKRIAEKSGFGSLDSLARAFRLRLGATPGEFRSRFGSA